MVFVLLEMKKGQLGFNQLAPWIIGVAVLVLIVVLYKSFSDKGTSIIDYLKNIWRFGS